MRGRKLLTSLKYNDLFEFGFRPVLFKVLAFENSSSDGNSQKIFFCLTHQSNIHSCLKKLTLFS